MQQKLVQIFFLQQAGTFGGSTGKEQQKPLPKLKNMYIIYLLRILALPGKYLLCFALGAYSEVLQHSHQTSPAAKFTSQGDAHVRTDAQIKFLRYALREIARID